MRSIIRASGTIFCLLLYLNSRLGFNGLKYVYSVISVKIDSLPANTTKSGIDPFVDGRSEISQSLGADVCVDVKTSVHKSCARFSLHLYITALTEEQALAFPTRLHIYILRIHRRPTYVNKAYIYI